MNTVTWWTRRGLAAALILVSSAGSGWGLEDPVVVPPDDEAVAGDDGMIKSTELAAKYGVTVEQVEALRTTDGMGWGEVEIALGLAESLAAKDPTGAGDINAALLQITEARAAGGGWGKIANDLGLNLGEVVSGAKRARPEAAGIGERPEKPDMLEKPDRPAKAVKPDKPEKAMKPDKPEKPDKVEKPEKPAKPDKPDKPDMGNKP